MKKSFLIIVSFFFLVFNVFSAEGYRISYVNYDIEGCGAKVFGRTQEYSLEHYVVIDTKKVFATEEELNLYVADLEVRLGNLRAFDTINIEVIKIKETEEGICNVQLNIFVKDSFHLFAIPGPKYNSNTGITFKLKIKDTNFLGSLDTMSSGIYFTIPTKESDAIHAEFGFDFSFDYPFKAGIFDASWLNDLSFSYTIGDTMPEWDVNTGLRLELPFDKTKLVMEVDQAIVNNFDYKEFGDNLYFEDALKFSAPLTLTEFKKFGNLYYTPYTELSVCWDFNGISKENSALSSPVLTIGHQLSFGRVDWDQNLRTGINFYVDNSYTYNFQRKRFYPYIQTEFQGYKKFDIFKDSHFLRNFGIASDIVFFTFILNPKKDIYINNDGKEIGSYLRGIRDNQDYSGTNISALNPTNALILNLDFPIHIFSTYFSKSFLKYFNFDFQLSPFFDMALCYNKINQTFFDFNDGFYSAGLEVIVYPLKWTGITVRGSIGIDIGRTLFSNGINKLWRDDVSTKEFQIGFGLHY